MKNQTFDLDDYISQRKERDSDFANGFDTGYEEFKRRKLLLLPA